jgi:hypothetical protein
MQHSVHHLKLASGIHVILGVPSDGGLKVHVYVYAGDTRLHMKVVMSLP